METVGDFLFVFGVWAGIISLVGTLIYFFIKAQTMAPEIRIAWEEAEMLLGLYLKSPRVGFPSLEGTYDNQSVKLRASPANNGKDPSPEMTHYTVYHKNNKMPILQLQLDNDFFLTRDKEVGDIEFDDKFHITYANQEVVKTVFADVAIREKILDLRRPLIYINKKRLVISEIGIQDDPQIIKLHLELAVELANQVETFNSNTVSQS